MGNRMSTEVQRWLVTIGVWAGWLCIALLALNEEAARMVVVVYLGIRFIQFVARFLEEEASRLEAEGARRVRAHPGGG